MTAPGSLSIVVINFGTPELIRRLLDTLCRHGDRAFVQELVLVDNGYPQRGDIRAHVSPSDCPLRLEFVQNAGTSYASGVNAGVRATRGRLIAIANSDVEWPADGGIGPLLEEMLRDPRIGIAGPQLLNADGSWQRSFGVLPGLGEAVRTLLLVDIVRGALWTRALRRGAPAGPPRSVDFLNGAFMVVRRTCFERLGGFDERYDFYGEDADFCFRAKQAGWKRRLVPSARLTHVGGASSTRISSVPYLQRLFRAKHAFVEMHHGPRTARRYARLLRLAAWELALIYGVVARLRPTPAWRWRAEQAALALQAARGIDYPARAAE